MKKIITIFLIAFIFFGCTANSDLTEQMPQESGISETIDSSNKTPISDNSQQENIYEINEQARVLKPNEELKNDYLTNRYSYPTTIEMFIGKDGDEIGFIFEYSVIGLTDEDYSYDCPKDEWNNMYLYYGKLTKIADNVYQSSGDLIPSWDKYENYVKEGVDFYVVISDEKYYFIYEELSLEELINYQSDCFANFKNFVD